MFYCSLGYRYEVVTKKASFSTAISDCESKSGTLALPSSAAAEAEILQAMTDQKAHTAIFVNLKEDDSNKLTTGQEYTNYNPGEPNDADERCVVMQYPTGKWNDYQCIKLKAYVCQFTCKYLDFKSR